MEKKIISNLTKRSGNKWFSFEMVGFNEVYVHDNERRIALFLEKTYGSARLKVSLAGISRFEDFVNFSKMIYTNQISMGDGYLGNKKESQLKKEIDIKTFALIVKDDFKLN